MGPIRKMGTREKMTEEADRRADTISDEKSQ